MKLKTKEGKGITLIALVITIIVLLILAAVSIVTLTGEYGILTKANKAKTETEESGEKERIQLEVFGSYGEDGKLKLDTLKSNITKNIKEATHDDATDFPLTVTYTATGNSYEVESDGNVELPKEEISKTDSFVGYYADIDADGTVDGVIYADLAMGNTGSGKWADSDGTYTIPTISSKNIKSYYISKTGYEGDYGTKDVLSPTGLGADRFYMMALKDIDGQSNGTDYEWYNAAYGKMDDYSTATSGDFGTGKQNTQNMIAKWNSKAYGGQNTGSCLDMWGQIQDEVSEGWFVPSRGEWSAFNEELGVRKSNLSREYWTSTQGDNHTAWFVDFSEWEMNWIEVTRGFNVRLSATF